MKLGPFVTSRAPIGAQSGAALQGISNKVSAGYNKLQNTQRIQQLGNEALKVGLAGDLNKSRATVAMAENNARTLIEENPDYIDADIVEDMGVEIDEKNIVELQDGTRRVRTHQIAGELYSKSVDAGMEAADNKLSFPTVTNRLKDEVDQKYRTAGANRVGTWAAGKERELGRAEYRNQVDAMRENGQFAEVMAITETAVAGGLISDAEGFKQRDITRVSEEMRDTSITIMAVENDYTKVQDLKDRIELYEDHIINETSIVSGMTPDKMYAERNRMLTKLQRIESAHQTTQSVSMVKATRELKAVVAGIPQGVSTISQAEIDGYKGMLRNMTATGAGTETQRETLRYNIMGAEVVMDNAPGFSAIQSGSAEEALAARNAMGAKARNMEGSSATEAIMLTTKTDQAWAARNAQITNNAAGYMIENDTTVQQAHQEMLESGHDPVAVGNYVDAQGAAQARMQVPPESSKAFDINDPYAVKLKDDLTNGNWEDKQAVLESLHNGLPEEQYALVAKSLSSTDKQATTAQMIMQTYSDSPDIARKISQGVMLTNVPLKETELTRMVQAELEQTLDPAVIDGMTQSFAGYYRSQIAAGVPGYVEDPDADAVKDMVETITGPEVAFTTPWRFDSDADNLFSESDPTRGFRDEGGNWKDPTEVKNLMMAEVQADTGTYNIQGESYTLTEIAAVANIALIGNGKYRVDVPQAGGGFLPLRTEGLESGELVVLDLIKGQ
jgi:hypothetical protein